MSLMIATAITVIANHIRVNNNGCIYISLKDIVSSCLLSNGENDDNSGIHSQNQTAEAETGIET